MKNLHIFLFLLLSQLILSTSCTPLNGLGDGPEAVDQNQVQQDDDLRLFSNEIEFILCQELGDFRLNLVSMEVELLEDLDQELEVVQAYFDYPDSNLYEQLYYAKKYLHLDDLHMIIPMFSQTEKEALSVQNLITENLLPLLEELNNRICFLLSEFKKLKSLNSLEQIELYRKIIDSIDLLISRFRFQKTKDESFLETTLSDLKPCFMNSDKVLVYVEGFKIIVNNLYQTVENYLIPRILSSQATIYLPFMANPTNPLLTNDLGGYCHSTLMNFYGVAPQHANSHNMDSLPPPYYSTNTTR